MELLPLPNILYIQCRRSCIILQLNHQEPTGIILMWDTNELMGCMGHLLSIQFNRQFHNKFSWCSIILNHVMPYCNVLYCTYPTLSYCTILLCHATLCYAMLCYAMLCYVMLCYAILCYAMLCYACYTTLCYPILYKVIYYVMLSYAK